MQNFNSEQYVQNKSELIANIHKIIVEYNEFILYVKKIL